jgi:ectoine hydroxylase-related dioxygenase (phytanoyl-CoA dioxygenase family)
MLSAGQKEAFERDGFLVVDSTGCSDEVLDGIVRDLDGVYGEPRMEDGVLYRRRRVKNAWKLSENVKALALAPKLLAMLEELYDRKPLALQTLNFPVGTEQRPHSDAMHFNSEPPGYMCGIWVALEQMDVDNGPLIYYPGSHKLPYRTMEEAVPLDRNDYPDLDSYMAERSRRYEDYVAEQIEVHGLQPQLATIGKGQALFWAANLVHGGSACNDRSRSRHSQVTHYFFEGCRYYYPISTVGSEIAWLDPEWVS